MNNKEILDIFRNTGALLNGHFILTSGRHSPSYFQCARVLQYPEYLTHFASMIAEHFKETEIETVISPAIGGVVLVVTLNWAFMFVAWVRYKAGIVAS